MSPITAADTQTEQPVSEINNNEISLFLKTLHIVIVFTNSKNNVYNGKKCLQSI